jgi:hypothetical protein
VGQGFDELSEVEGSPASAGLKACATGSENTSSISEVDVRRYHHIGIPTRVQRPGETYLEKYRLFCTDHESNPFGIQWMRFEAQCSLPELVKTVPHVAFEVDDLQEALAGQEVLIPPNSPSEGVVVAFVLCDGAPVEFLQFLK